FSLKRHAIKKVSCEVDIAAIARVYQTDLRDFFENFKSIFSVIIFNFLLNKKKTVANFDKHNKILMVTFFGELLFTFWARPQVFNYKMNGFIYFNERLEGDTKNLIRNKHKMRFNIVYMNFCEVNHFNF
ncbi:hypothetical protein BpHYR1_009352, partial [Brachionus plicatilis]